MKLSIIIPVYNEEKTVIPLLKKVINVVIPDVIKEIIVVDDGSTDGSKIKITNANLKEIKLIMHKKNQGKGAAVKTGLKKASGDYILIQDADLEYDPQQIGRMIRPILEGKAQVIYGTRLKRLPNFHKDERTIRFFVQYLGNKFLSLITSLLYLQWLTDMETCYKLFPKNAFKNISLHAKGFEFEPEITAKLLKSGYKIVEIPIVTTPRGYNEGKKLRAIRDGIHAFWALVKYRFRD